MSWRISVAIVPIVGFSLVNCGSEAKDNGPADAAAGSGGMAGAGGSGGTSGAPSGCSATQPCSAAEFCRYYDQSCGTGKDLAHCTTRVQPCDQTSPVCTCTGEVRPSTCDAWAAGLDLSVSGACDVPAGFFRCGSAFCGVGTQYCQVWLTDMMGSANSFSCEAVPPNCGAPPTCNCLQAGCGTCQSDKDGNLTVSCFMGR